MAQGPPTVMLDIPREYLLSQVSWNRRESTIPTSSVYVIKKKEILIGFNIQDHKRKLRRFPKRKKVCMSSSVHFDLVG